LFIRFGNRLHPRRKNANDAKSQTPATMKIGETVEMGDWEVTLNSFTFEDSVTQGMLRFSPDEGHKMGIADVTVKNNGTSVNTFLPAFSFGDDDVSVSLVYDGKYEFQFTNYLGLSGQLHMESFNPLSSKTGTIYFEVSEEVATSDKPLVLKFKYKRDEYLYNIR